MKPFLALLAAVAVTTAETITSDSFSVTIDETTGGLISLTDPQADSSRNWVGSATNTPWQPLGSRWGLGFFDAGGSSLHRTYWNGPATSCSDDSTCTSSYTAGPLTLSVQRSAGSDGTLTETYNFKNTGADLLNLATPGTTSFAIFTPFNDHYTNTTDALANRAHTHVWAHGGRNAWVKTNQMGGNDRDLGLVLTKGSLVGYSIEGRDATTLSNTRGVFLLHPSIPTLAPGEESVLEWTLFWHQGWDDFFTQCQTYSEQFVRVETDAYTFTQRTNTTLTLSGQRINAQTTINNTPLTCTSTSNGTICSLTFGILPLAPTADILANRVNFITQNQQVTTPNTSTTGVYILYDNQIRAQVTFDTSSDRNAGRERVGMGNLLARWLRRNPDADPSITDSFSRYYEYVCTQLQDATGYVNSGLGNNRKRLYNWPWVLQLHINTAALNLTLPAEIAGMQPIERFMLTLENFYAEGGGELYAIGLPIFESLRYLNRTGNTAAYERARELFTAHGDFILQRGLNYPAFEVNFEQSIVAPAAIILLELYRSTGEQRYFEGAEVQMETLLRFAGKQPDYRLHDVAIRHWDGDWFGKDRMWGDIFPHHWSALNAIALHHYSRAIDSSTSSADLNSSNSTSPAAQNSNLPSSNTTLSALPSLPLSRRDTPLALSADDAALAAQRVLTANLALFFNDGSASCAYIYPTSVNGRQGGYADGYANDQDWALNHLLMVEDEGRWD